MGAKFGKKRIFLWGCGLASLLSIGLVLLIAFWLIQPNPQSTPTPVATTEVAIGIEKTATPTPTSDLAETEVASEEPTVTFTPPPTATSTSASDTGPSPTPRPLEVITGTIISNRQRLGELKVKYPLRMSPGSSDSVLVSIYIPDQLVSLVPMEIERIDIPPDAPPIIGELNSYLATILIAKTMRVELSSPTFQIEKLYPATQPVNIDSFSEPTSWAWTIVASDTVGAHVLTLRVYPGGADRPSWVGSIEIEVKELSPTPIPFFNTSGGIAIIGAAGVIIVALAIGLFRYRVARNAFPIVSPKASYRRTLKTLHQNLAHLEERAAQYGLDVPLKLMNEIEAIKEKIAEIEAILAATEAQGPES